MIGSEPAPAGISILFGGGVVERRSIQFEVAMALDFLSGADVTNACFVPYGALKVRVGETKPRVKRVTPALARPSTSQQPDYVRKDLARSRRSPCADALFRQAYLRTRVGAF